MNKDGSEKNSSSHQQQYIEVTDPAIIAQLEAKHHKPLITPIKDDRQIIKPTYIQSTNTKDIQMQDKPSTINAYEAYQRNIKKNKTKAEQRQNNNEKKTKYVEKQYKLQKGYYSSHGENGNVFQISQKSNKRDVEVKIQEALNLYDVVIIEATGLNIIKALSIANLVCEANRPIKRINTPRIIQQKYQKGYEIPAVTIRLSLHYLDNDHIGYQDYPDQKTRQYDREHR